MRFKVKLLIFIVAVVLSFLWFNLIASSSGCLFNFAKESPYEEIEILRARFDIETLGIRQPDFKDSKFASLSPYPGESR